MAEQTRVEELERLLREAQLRAEREQQRAETAEQQTRATTLDEYIAACHSLVFSRFEVETDKSLTSKGSITNPRNKLCPTSLKPWPDFLEQQRVAFGVLYDALPAQTRLFESRNFLSGLGDRISQRPIANEKDLETFLHNSVEDPVRSILHQLKEVEQVQSVYGIGGGIIFENHPSAISDVSEEVVHREMSSPPRTPDQGRLSNQLRPDQICVYRSEDGKSTRRSMIYVCEYKAPHKLTAPHLRVGLRPMNVYKEVVNRKTIPTSADPEGRFQYHAEKLTTAAISQTYHYMIEGGLDYGLLTTGETIVFLKIDWEDPQTLYYHLAEPGPEVSAHPNHFHSCTAVGQYLAFTLVALGQPGQRREHGQEERRLAIQGLKTWAEDFESTLRSIPASERSAPSGFSDYEPTTYEGIDRSPYPFRHDRRPVSDKDQPDRQPARRDSPESSDDESRSNLPDTPSPAERRTGSREQGTRRSQRIHAQRPRGAAARGGSEYTRQYCTQKCLVGMVRGRLLDIRCPNVTLHKRWRGPLGPPQGGIISHHPVSHRQWLQLLRKQLEDSLDNGVTPLCEGGARGVLFQVTLLAYGYTFIGKGTVRAFIEDLEHEAAVYDRLKAVQGINVPVFLGTMDLRSMNKIYYYDHRVYVVHVILLSWGGYKLSDIENVNGMGKTLADGALRSLQSIHREGVVHKDVRAANMLFNPETNRVMVIDFERSLLVQPPRRALAQLVPNKRAWNSETTEKRKGRVRVSGQQQGCGDVVEDISMARSAFSELNCLGGDQDDEKSASPELGVGRSATMEEDGSCGYHSTELATTVALPNPLNETEDRSMDHFGNAGHGNQRDVSRREEEAGGGSPAFLNDHSNANDSDTIFITGNDVVSDSQSESAWDLGAEVRKVPDNHPCAIEASSRSAKEFLENVWSRRCGCEPEERRPGPEANNRFSLEQMACYWKELGVPDALSPSSPGPSQIGYHDNDDLDWSIFALTLCVLSGCRTSAESKYSLINADHTLLTASFGEDCVKAGISVIPDLYKTGLAGACRVKDGSATCESSPPGHPSLNWIDMFESDLNLAASANTTTPRPPGSSNSTIAHCLNVIASNPVDHAYNNRLASALLALLAICIVLNIATTAVALFSVSAFALPVFFPGLVDEILLVTCLGIYLGIMNHEAGSYIMQDHQHDIDGKAVLGVGFWLLLSTFAVRALSMPALLATTVLVAVSIPLVVISLVLCVVGCAEAVAGTVEFVPVIYYF
ncbi:protein kinase-like domain [Pochonia chlamydosporia 170]|uniref:non-specific serine/threonine protein kinase n=1 Tax=Pochonia chlamydosporia 170 TaxID=1380566 RepID=A0A179EWR8_METCM|nr:protein kinase-like domain [Pochonia chlamydosporia 170]OAQ57369.1 protein kinase-like domain [Pochonia chlamydosporia 170]